MLRISWFYFQHEAKMQTMGISLKEMESKKRILEEAVDALNEDMAKMKAEGKDFGVFVNQAVRSMENCQPSIA